MRYIFHTLLLMLLFPVLSYNTPAPKLVSTRIQILTPFSVNLHLSDTFNIAIIANIYTDTRPDSLVMAKYPTDSVLAVKTAFALKNKLEDSPVFADYDFPVYNYRRDDNKLYEEGLSLDVAAQLAKDVQADYLFTVDIVNTHIWYDIAYAEHDGVNISYASSNVPYKFIFRFYNIRSNRIEDTQIVNDTLVIETSSSWVRDAMDLFKEIIIGREAVTMACEQAGESYAELIAPHWTDEIRYYYNDGSRDMDRANKYVDNQQWLEAMDIWMKYSASSNQKQAAMACFNMALACEMADDFGLATEWLNLAKKKDSGISIMEYETILQIRIKQLEKLKIENTIK